MEIVIINGSPRLKGATSTLLNNIQTYFQQKPDVTTHYFHLDTMMIASCKGCCHCFKSGSCFIDDDAERLSLLLQKADGVIIASPTYASNVSGQLKTFIDRGHLVLEQLLYGKYGMSIVTYENYGGHAASKIINAIFRYSGASISSQLLLKLPFTSSPTLTQKNHQLVIDGANRLYKAIKTKRTYPIQKLIHHLIFHIGIKPFVLKKGPAYQGIRNHWHHHK